MTPSAPWRPRSTLGVTSSEMVVASLSRSVRIQVMPASRSAIRERKALASDWRFRSMSDSWESILASIIIKDGEVTAEGA
jgi:hypothetical protein